MLATPPQSAAKLRCIGCPAGTARHGFQVGGVAPLTMHESNHRLRLTLGIRSERFLTAYGAKFF